MLMTDAVNNELLKYRALGKLYGFSSVFIFAGFIFFYLSHKTLGIKIFKAF